MHDINELRRHLFETLDAVRDEKKPMDLRRADRVVSLAQTLINSGKMECEFIELLGCLGTAFFPDSEKKEDDDTLSPKQLRVLNGARFRSRRT